MTNEVGVLPPVSDHLFPSPSPRLDYGDRNHETRVLPRPSSLRLPKEDLKTLGSCTIYRYGRQKGGCLTSPLYKILSSVVRINSVLS